MNGFEVIKPGILTLVQDKGRFGLMSKGITPSGAIDEFAYLWANYLLGNKLDLNVLEIAFSGLTLKANKNTSISVTGADISFSINDEIFKPWQSFKIKVGDVLKFSKNVTGQRAYLSVKNGFLIFKEFGSNSTTLKEGLGGIEGRALKKGDILPFVDSSYLPVKRLKAIYQPNYEQALNLRVVLGYQDENFSEEEKIKFFTKEFTVSKEANRMGIKLDGESIQADIDGIISEGICFGAIQIPKDGRPIVLLKDRQTIGGYPKIGSVLSIDCFKLSQVKPGTKITFQEISIEEALLKTKSFYKQFKNTEDK